MTLNEVGSTPRRAVFWLLTFWVIVTAFNITKAVHIDDAAYVEAARVMTHDFWNVMRYTVNGGPIYAFDQPHFFLYFLAGALKIFGESEVGLHLALSLFSATSIIFFYLLARHLAPRHSLLLTAVFAISPAFIPSQNLMCDIPMLALWLIFFWALLCPSRLSPKQRLVLAACACAFACLTKYTSLILLPILFLDIVIRRRGREFWVLLIPVAALAMWSAWNYWSYGGIHLLERQRNSVGSSDLLLKVQSWLLCVGAVVPAGAFFLPRILAMHRWRYTLIGVALVGIMSFCFDVLFSQTAMSLAILRTSFFMIGILCFIGVLASLYSMWMKASDNRSESPIISRNDVIILSAWAGIHTAFIVQFSPFLAVRHVLPMVALILLMVGRNGIPYVRPRLVWVGASLSMLLGVTIAISDWQYADAYRKQAFHIKASLPENAVAWQAGRWGWEWYATKNGFRQFNPKQSQWHTGDYLVVPQLAGVLSFTPAQQRQMRIVGTVKASGGFFTIFRTMLYDPFGGFYYQGDGLPWTISTKPLETFHIYKINIKPDSPH